MEHNSDEIEEEEEEVDKVFEIEEEIEIIYEDSFIFSPVDGRPILESFIPWPWN